jgi:valyl-tRNA synthetase
MKNNYKNKTTKELVDNWCYNPNRKQCEEIEAELENRGFDLTAESIQELLFED